MALYTGIKKTIPEHGGCYKVNCIFQLYMGQKPWDYEYVRNCAYVPDAFLLYTDVLLQSGLGVFDILKAAAILAAAFIVI